MSLATIIQGPSAEKALVATGLLGSRQIADTGFHKYSEISIGSTKIANDKVLTKETLILVVNHTRLLGKAAKIL